MALEKKIWIKYALYFAILGGVFSCRQSKKYHDKVSTTPQVVLGSSALHLAHRDSIFKTVFDFQEALNTSFRDPEASPLPPKEKMVFEGLDFFLPNASFIVPAKLVRTPEALPFGMPTTTGGISEERLYGTLLFTVKDQSYALEVYQSSALLTKPGYENYLFLPFTDLTNGDTTYEGGRYMDLRIPEGDTIFLDFNKAYNPYCAYNKKYSCPVVPAVNHMDIAVLAGVKAFK